MGTTVTWDSVIRACEWIDKREFVLTVPDDRYGKNHEAGIPTGKHYRTGFWQCRNPSGGSPWGMRLQIAFLFPKFSQKEKMPLMEEKLKEMQAEQPAKK